MTRLPVESREVEALTGPLYPKYKTGSLCSHPLCSRPATEKHHLFRRSFIIGDVLWVRFKDADGVLQTTGNVVGLCHDHHEELTVNIHRVSWLLDGQYWWVDGELGPVAPLNPQPPIHGRKADVQPVTGHMHGPASSDTCPSCGRRNKRETDPAKKEQLRKRKSWTVKVPDDDEDGATVLDSLVDACAELFGHETTSNLRFFTICQALALVLQNEQFLVESQ